MDRITRFSLKNAAAVVLVAVLITAGGVWSAGQLKKETMPDINIPVIAVVTVYPGAAPQDVYDNVTKPMEQALRGVAGVKQIQAQSGDSVSAVVAEFSFSQDMDEAEQAVNKAMSSVKMPDNALEPKLNRISFGSAPILKLAVMGDEGDPEALRADVRDRVIPALQGIEGVGEATLAADTPATIRIQLDPEKLEDEGLTAESVIQQLQAANLSFPIGAVDLGDTTEPIRVGGSVEGVEDIKKLQLAVYPNQNKLMGDAFAQIGEGMGALGQAVGGLAQGMGQGFSALGQGMGQLGQTTGEVAMQAGLMNGIQQYQMLKYETIPTLKKQAASIPDTSTPEYAQLQGQIVFLEQVQLPILEGQLKTWQDEISASQKRVLATAKSSASSSGGSLSSMKGSKGSMSAPKSGSSEMEVSIGTVLLEDVATVTYGPADGSVGSRANGSPAALIDIVKTQDANTVDVSEKVRAEMARLDDELPKGAKVVTVYDASKGINASVEGMMREGLLGALFAVVVILLFLRNWRATIIAAVSIPLSVLIAMVALKQTGVTLNVMTLGGLTVAIGRVVDDSIVVIENMFRHMQRGDARTPELLRAATSEVSAAITSSTLTTVAVFLPLGLVTGVIGKIFLPFAITVALSLLASLLVAVTIVPLMAKWFLLKSDVPHEPARESAMMRSYRKALSWSLSHRWAVVAGALALLVGSVALVPLIGTGFVPETAEKYLNIEVSYPEGTKATKVDETVGGIESLLAKNKQVEVYQSTIGGTSNSMGMSGGLGGTNKALTFVKLDTETDTDKTVATLKRDIAKLADKDAEVTISKVDSSGTNGSLDIIVTGPDLAAIRKGADIVEAKLEKAKGLENVSSNLGTSRRQLVVDVDQEKASEYGLNAAMVAGTVRGFVAEQSAGSVKVSGKPTEVVYTLKLDPVNKAEELKTLELATPLGDTIELQDIATVAEKDSPIAVLTRDGNEYAAVSARITERDSGSVISAVREDLETLKLPAGVKTEVSGAAEQMNESFAQLGMAMLIAIGAVYLVMIIAFGEAVAPLAIMMSLPLAVVGGLLGLLVAGLPLDIPAMIGALMLIGIVVTNAIVLVDRVQQKQRQGMSRHDSLMEAGTTRMRPILMTAVATIMALVPLASGFAEGALISQSLAVIVIGGLTTSTLLTLLVVPVAYDLLEGAKEFMFGRETHATAIDPEVDAA